MKENCCEERHCSCEKDHHSEDDCSREDDHGCEKGEDHSQESAEEYQCVVCDRSMPERNKQAHLIGKKHIRKLMVMSAENNIYLCDVCDLEMPAYSKDSHLRGKKHLRQVVQLFQEGSGTGTFFCTICDMDMPSYSKETHVRGRKHLRRMKLFYDPEADTYYCKTCDRTMPSHAQASHESGKVHLKRVANVTFLKQVETNKNCTDIRKASGIVKWECEICEKVIPSYSKASHLQGRAHKRQEKLKQEKVIRKGVQDELLSFDFVNFNRSSGSGSDGTILRKRNRVDSFFDETEGNFSPKNPTQNSAEKKKQKNEESCCRRERGESCSACDLADVVESTVLSVLPSE